jgi:phage terminase large subunit GpA-like protein
MSQFAQEEVVMPRDGGPFSGEPFNFDFQPYVRLLWDEIDSGNWSEAYVPGPTQSGKTFSSFVVPILYYTCELRKNTVVGVPIGEMIGDKWRVDILPVMEASPGLAKLIPERGPGAPGNKVVDSITLRNGVEIKFVTRGGSDASKAGFTASKIVVTEAAAWSRGIATSKEADPLAQVRGRGKSKSRFSDDGEIDSDRQMIVEGTVTVAEDLPWRAKKGSSESILVCPCVHCGEHVAPERDHFAGFEDCENELDAANSGNFFCPSCGEEITQKDREVMVKQVKLIHKGQSIDKSGVVTGEKPRTSILFFRWSAFHNLFLKNSDIAADAWRVKQIEEDTPERDLAEREESQQTWAIPVKPKLIDSAPLLRSEISSRKEKFPLGVVPDDTQFLVTGSDIGRWKCWFFAIAFRSNGTLHAVNFGSFDTGLSRELSKEERKIHEAEAIQDCLNRMADTFENGFPKASGGIIVPNLMLYDTRYATEATFKFVKQRGTSMKGPHLGIQGLGKTVMDKRIYIAPKATNSTVRRIGDRYHYEWSQKHRQMYLVSDVDYAKLEIQKCLRVTPGVAGALTMPLVSDQDLSQVSRHLASEIYRNWVDEKGQVKQEFRKFAENHLLDCAGYAWTGGKILGWKFNEGSTGVKPKIKAKKKLPSWLTNK